LEESKTKTGGRMENDINEIEKKIDEEEEISLEQLHQKYRELLYIENTDRIDVVLAVALSSQLVGIPLWLILVGPSGDMKSVQLESIVTENVFELYNLTSKTLVNGYPDKDKHPDLAPQFNNKIIIIKDMAQILKLPPVEKGEVWGQLRDLYDGFAGKVSGQGANSKYSNLKVTLLAGSTPVIDGQILIHQDLGTRELIYRTYGNKEKEKVMQKCLDNEEHESKIKKELKEITTKFLNQKKVIREKISQDVLNKIMSLAKYTAYMRTPAEFDNYTNELRNEVYPEEPTRISKQLKRLFVCLKSLDKDYSDETALQILRHVAKSSAFPMRIKIYECLIKQKEENITDFYKELSTSELAEKLKMGKSTIKRECSVLEALGLIVCRRELINSQYSDKTYDYWKYIPSKLIVVRVIV
jgi:DNA-binding transcriptional ArsR family regulator